MRCSVIFFLVLLCALEGYGVGRFLDDLLYNIPSTITKAMEAFIRAIKKPIKIKRLGNTGRTRSRSVRTTVAMTTPIPRRYTTNVAVKVASWLKPRISLKMKPLPYDKFKTPAAKNLDLSGAGRRISTTTAKSPFIPFGQPTRTTPFDHDEKTTLSLSNKVYIPIITEPKSKNPPAIKREYKQITETSLEDPASNFINQDVIKYVYHDNSLYVSPATPSVESASKSMKKNVILLI